MNVLEVTFQSLMALETFVGPWPLLQFYNPLYINGSLLQGRYLQTGRQKHRINAQTDILALNGIRTHDPSFQEREDISWLSSYSSQSCRYCGTAEEPMNVRSLMWRRNRQHKY
jgi:hypothetical protein